MWGFRSRSSATALVVTDAGDVAHDHFPLLAGFARPAPRWRPPHYRPRRMTPAVRRAIAGVALALAAAPSALAQAPNLPVDESVREQSCKSLQGGTAGMPDQAPAGPVSGIPTTWP